MIPFNKPYLSGKELQYISEAVQTGKISGDGMFTRKCHTFFQEQFGFERCLLTSSCTDALEMAAILLEIAPGDEVIAPAYTFVSTVNAFVLRGARIVFIDSKPNHPNIDEEQIEAQITPKTKAIVVVHYAGIACNMDKILDLGRRYGIPVVEDAAQAVDSYYKGAPLGGLGILSAFSFHETKNIISGEGGMLVINDPALVNRAEIIREKGTNRSQFFRGEVDKYGWVDIGSSFLPSELTAAFLYAQLEKMGEIQQRRKETWQRYKGQLQELEKKGFLELPFIPDYASNNAHMFYILCPTLEERTRLAAHLKQKNILAVFHYLSLHSSPYFKQLEPNYREMPNSDRFTDCLLRLPLYYELEEQDQHSIIASIFEFYAA